MVLLAQLLHLTLNRFCLVFRFPLYNLDCPLGQYIPLRLVTKIVRLEQQFLKNRVIDIIGNRSGSVPATEPHNIFFAQKMLLPVV